MASADVIVTSTSACAVDVFEFGSGQPIAEGRQRVTMAKMFLNDLIIMNMRSVLLLLLLIARYWCLCCFRSRVSRVLAIREPKARKTTRGVYGR